MFGIGPMEAVVIVMLALIVLGPAKFPEAGRAVGRALREFRAVTDDLTREVRTSFDEPQEPSKKAPARAVRHDDPEYQEDGPAPAPGKSGPPEDNQPGPV